MAATHSQPATSQMATTGQTAIDPQRVTPDRTYLDATRARVPLATHSLRSSTGRSGHTRTVEGRPSSSVEEVLRALPSHGWPDGWIGRRDRALLVLAELAGLHPESIAALAGGDLTIAGGVAVIKTTGGTTKLRGNEDGLLCGPCGLARWVHALDLTVVYPDGRVIAAVIARAVPLRSDSPHLCHSNNSITEVTRRVPLLPPIDRWGHPIKTALPLQRTASALQATSRARTSVINEQVPATLPSRPARAAAAFADVDVRARELELRVGQLLRRPLAP